MTTHVIRIVAFLCLLLTAPQAAHAAERGSRPAPTFSGTTLDGGTLDFDAAHQPQPSLLVFWASWCANCVEEMPKLQALHADVGSRVRFLGININLEPADGRAAQVRFALPYPSLSDPDLTISDRFDVHGTPVLLLIDAGGNIVARGRSLDDKLLAAIRHLADPAR